MRVLVTGSNGLVGYSIKKFIHTRPDDEFIMLTRQDCDLTDYTQVHNFFLEHAPIDVVVHLASRVGGVYYNTSTNYEFFHDNIKINTNIIHVCKRCNVKQLINVLSTCIFPDIGVKYPLTSDQLHNGICHKSNLGYAYSKRVLHVGSGILSQLGTTKVVNLIPTNLYGENDNYNITQAHVIPALIHKASNAKGSLEVFGTGNALRQFVFSDDLARVILHFLGKLDLPCEVNCIVSPPETHEISIGDIAKSIATHFNNVDVHFNTTYSDGQYKKTTNDNELRQYIPDFTFTPFNDGLKIVLDYFTKNYDNIRK